MNHIKSLTALVAILFLSLSAQATTINYNGYSRNTTSNIVSGHGKDWLMWTETKGKSIDWFLNSTEAEQLRNDGWRVAQRTEMDNLFTDFNFLGRTFTSTGNSFQAAAAMPSFSMPGASELIAPFEQFGMLFGRTGSNEDNTAEYSSSGLGSYWYLSSAFFLGESSVISIGSTSIDRLDTELRHYFSLSAVLNQYYPGTFTDFYTPGIALVKATRPTNPDAIPVSEPATLILLCSSLLIIGFRFKAEKQQ